MKRTLLTALLALATVPAIAQPPHTFSTEAGYFTLDGKPFKVLSGELHYARIPREYWHARLKMARAMGLNTIATYVFWNVHEPTPNHYDFTGQYDVAAFIKAAQEEGLYVILRAGPYSCAEWANDGRINSTKLMRGESKGITHTVTLAGIPLTHWQVYPLPMTNLPKKFVILSGAPQTSPQLAFASRYPEASASGLSSKQQEGAGSPRLQPWVSPGVCPSSGCPQSQALAPAFYRAHFTLTQTGDTFLDIRNLGKGALWINGHPIGRFWNIGPQQTLYVPAPWLQKGDNEIVIFDLIPSASPPRVAGLDHPILDGPVSDQTTSPQQ